jgi:hypothetical protein
MEAKDHETPRLDAAPKGADVRGPFETFSDDELDALEALAEFEIEHRRILAMQTLFYKRRKGGVA